MPVSAAPAAHQAGSPGQPAAAQASSSGRPAATQANPAGQPAARATPSGQPVRLVVVTSLRDAGSGSLRAAISGPPASIEAMKNALRAEDVLCGDETPADVVRKDAARTARPSRGRRTR